MPASLFGKDRTEHVTAEHTEPPQVLGAVQRGTVSA